MKSQFLLALAASTLLAQGLLAFQAENVTTRDTFSNSRLAFEKKKTGRVAFMGGSITEMNGLPPDGIKMARGKVSHNQVRIHQCGHLLHLLDHRGLPPTPGRP